VNAGPVFLGDSIKKRETATTSMGKKKMRGEWVLEPNMAQWILSGTPRDLHCLRTKGEKAQ